MIWKLAVFCLLIQSAETDAFTNICCFFAYFGQVNTNGEPVIIYCRVLLVASEDVSLVGSLSTWPSAETRWQSYCQLMIRSEQGICLQLAIRVS